MHLKLGGLLFISCLALTLSAQKSIVVDQHAQLRNITGNFNSIEVHGSIELFVSQAETTALAVSTGGNKGAEITTEVLQNVLIIRSKHNGSWKNNGERLSVYIACATLKNITATGAGTVQVAGSFITDSLSITASGASDFKGNIAVQYLTIDLSGASDITISGTAAYLSINSRGASDVKGYGLATNICTINCSGASDVQLTVNQQATVNLSGASAFYYKGKGDINIVQLRGSSDVKNKN